MKTETYVNLDIRSFENADSSGRSLQTAPPSSSSPLVYRNTCEVQEAKYSLGATVSLTDDGRVNMHFNRAAKTLSRLLYATPKNKTCPLAAIPENYVPPPTFEEPTDLPPLMNIVIHVVGSRGDVQPFVALGKVLAERYGHRVRLATHPVFQKFVEEHGLEFFSIGGDPAELMLYMVHNPSGIPGKQGLTGGLSASRRQLGASVDGCWRSCFETGNGMGEPDEDRNKIASLAVRPFVADVIIANPPSFIHFTCAERLGIPLHMCFTMPWSPTHAYAHPQANVFLGTEADDSTANWLSYPLMDLCRWQGLRDLVNRLRRTEMGLAPLESMAIPNMLSNLKVPFTYCWSPALIPKPADWPDYIICSGFFFLKLARNYSPSPELMEFLQAGPTPIYIGFGSVMVPDAKATTQIIFGAIQQSGQRAVVLKGWGDLGSDEDKPEHIFIVDNVPHDWLFQHVSCVVHHGGAGTTSAAIAAGKPNVVVPFFMDQPFWGEVVVRAGVGPSPVPFKKLTVNRLVEAIKEALSPEIQARAAAIGERIRQEDGTAVGAQFFHRTLDIDKMRCALAPRRTAAWVTKKGVPLSAFAAAVLVKSNFLSYEDLKLYRVKEYNTKYEPPDPFSGGTTAVLGTVTDVCGGLLEAPVAAVSAVKKCGSNFDNSHKLNDTITSTSTLSTQASDASTQSATPPRNKRKWQTAVKDGIFDTSRGAGKAVSASVKAPAKFALRVTRGLHNAPRLYGDTTVRETEKIVNFRVGLRVAGKEFIYGLQDGVSGLVTQPLRGARSKGPSGFVKGVGRGLGGLIFKPGAGLLALIAYPAQGMYMEYRRFRHGKGLQKRIMASRMAQGLEEFNAASIEERLQVMQAWRAHQSEHRGKLDRIQSHIYETLDRLSLSPPSNRSCSSVCV
eukprot:Blabericola_migrator_1__2392@NODE_1671_length_4044_cov_226_150616_g1085_i0_p1_GENE_NODE_1671_length_4044_cov_226_150616_g1085_i0NODE_1671_length_4044_cov_226_150616_g1085_i0_p1_ORF_typecomplete_len899_score133_52Glyco_transf_28/PF03033_20/5_4e36UDPGT/PF00201_18/1_8e27ATG_C/PF09333_11/8e03ATG_C/PF09333_11/1e03ATG_C/PF09333_11/2e11Glyco_tran_28_C/PF04101_16/1_2e07VPS13_C/PF16909_5/0_0029_NODE_1671_length_4044_cov_226_150616_g1085_i011483844